MNSWDSSSMKLQELPHDITMLISRYIPTKELLTGLCRTNHQYHDLFGNDAYWQERLRGRAKDYCKFLLNFGSPIEWKRRVYMYEKITDSFKWGLICQKFLGKDVQTVLGNFQRLEFSGNGQYLAFCTKDRHSISVWNLSDLIARGDEPNLIFYPDHDQKVTSLVSQGSLLSSGAWDGTVSIRDLTCASHPPVQKLCSTGLVTCHSWIENEIVVGTRGGAIEIFDTRLGEDPQLREKVFLPTEVCNDFKMQRNCHSVVMAGWDAGVRKLKLYDLRNSQIINESDIGTWNLSMHLSDGLLWIGADKGRVLLYDPGTLELKQDYTSFFGHLSNVGWLKEVSFLESVRSIIYSHGHLFTADLRQVKVHEIRRKPKLLWEHELVFSELALCESQCYLACAEGHTEDQIRLLYRKDI